MNGGRIESRPLEDVHGAVAGATPTTTDTLAILQRELATDMARADLECYAAQVSTPEGHMPRYDITWLNRDRATSMDPDDMARCVARAVRYLDLIGGLDRPNPKFPHIVSVSRALHEQMEARLQQLGVAE